VLATRANTLSPRRSSLLSAEPDPHCYLRDAKIVSDFRAFASGQVSVSVFPCLLVCLSQELAFHMEATWTYPTVCCNEIGIHVSTKVRVGLLPYGTLSYNSGLRKFRHGQSIVETCYQLSSTKMDAQSVINWTVDNACNGRPLVCHTDPPALSTARFRCAGLSAFRQLW